ncbi:hypothetical protein, partial [Escherichia coli]|uniref:hypothetical protein n=1 Tax=Escherichia coli TaxID=562 RepID=UPI001BFCBD88
GYKTTKKKKLNPCFILPKKKKNSTKDAYSAHLMRTFLRHFVRAQTSVGDSSAQTHVQHTHNRRTNQEQKTI